MRNALLRVISAVAAVVASTATVYAGEEPAAVADTRDEESGWRSNSEHYHYHPTLAESEPAERNAELLTVTAPRHARRGLATTMSLRFRKVTGNAIVRLHLSPGLAFEQAIPSAERGPDGELLWFGLAGPTGNLKVKARIDADVPIGTALLIHADLIDSQGRTERQTETIVVR
jgi:hypothetical protein